MKKILSGKSKRQITLIMLVVYIALITLSAFIGVAIQTAGWTVKVVKLTNETNTGTKSIVASGASTAADYLVEGHVASGILYIPKNAYRSPAPGLVMTHGAFNNKEMQLAFAIEAARRGFVVLVVDGYKHGDNEELEGIAPGDFLLQAGKYLYNLTSASGKQLVDRDKIGVSGHSMGGAFTNSALQLDGVDTTDVLGNVGNTAEALSAGLHMGIFSAGIPEASDPDNSYYGSNLLGVGVIKGSADEWYFNSTMKEPTYIMISKDMMTQDIFNQGIAGTYQAVYAYNPTSFSMQWSGSVDGKLYVKQGGQYTAVTSDMKFDKGTQYYKYDTHGNSIFFLSSSEAMTFTNSMFDAASYDGPAYVTQNKGVYDFATGQLIDPSQANGKRLSEMTKGVQQASEAVRIRAVYEEVETHPMNHFSIGSTGNLIDFYYNVFGVPSGASYKAPGSQTWWIKEAVASLGFIGMFGLIIVLVDILLKTRAFGKLAVEEEDLPAPPELLRKPRKHITYWATGLAVCIFGAYSYSNINNNGKWYANSFWYKIIEDSTSELTGRTYFQFQNAGMIAYWGIVCALFALCITGAIWLINRIVNMIVYKDEYPEHDEHPFDAFKVRSWSNILRTLGLAVIVVAVFYGIVFLLWNVFTIDFRFWTFDLRHFNLDKLPSILRYVPFFFIYYMVNAALGVNYRVKDLPEWATIIINVAFNILGVLILVLDHNIHNLTYGNMKEYGNSLMYLLSYPIIPCVAFGTVVSRRLYTRTGNAWLSGTIVGTIMTIMCCANTNFV